jgi:hypothetical protein
VTSRAVSLGAAGVLAGCLAGAGCYSYRPLAAPPAPESQVSVVLTDQGRVETGRAVGPGADRVEGALVRASDTTLLLSVRAVKPLSGGVVRWAGETVSVRREHVARLYERRFSRGRTAVFVGGVVAAMAVIVGTTDLFGLGFLSGDDGGAGGDPQDQ